MQISYLIETDTMSGLVQVSRLDSYPSGVKRETGESVMNQLMVLIPVLPPQR